MNFFLGYVSSDKNACLAFQEAKADFINEEIKKELNYVEFRFGVFNPEMEKQSFEEFIYEKTKNSHGALILADNQDIGVINNVISALFVCIPEPSKKGDYRGFFRKNFTQALKNYMVLSVLMQNSAEEQALILPRRNFFSDELNSLHTEFIQHSLCKTFSDWLRLQVKELRKRRQPRRSTQNKKCYFVDDKDRYFGYGHENHGSFDTAHPHTRACEINGTFRFGRRLESIHRHFNVFYDQKNKTVISGNFVDCHETISSVSERTHLNVFCNDFHR